MDASHREEWIEEMLTTAPFGARITSLIPTLSARIPYSAAGTAAESRICALSAARSAVPVFPSLPPDPR